MSDCIWSRDVFLLDGRHFLMQNYMKTVRGCREFKSFIANFDSATLTVQQLALISVCYGVDGANFVRRVQRISPHIPPMLSPTWTNPVNDKNLLCHNEVRGLSALRLYHDDIWHDYHMTLSSLMSHQVII